MVGRDWNPDVARRRERRLREAREVETFGIEIERLRSEADAIVIEDGKVVRENAAALANDYLSTANEMVRMRLLSQATQAINRAKWIMDEYLRRGRLPRFGVTEGGERVVDQANPRADGGGSKRDPAGAGEEGRGGASEEARQEGGPARSAQGVEDSPPERNEGGD